MKKQLLLIGLIFTMFVAYSQTIDKKSEPQTPATADTVANCKDEFCPHRIWLHLGAGYACNTFKQIKDISNITSFTAMAEVGYTYFFHRNVGIGFGVGINYAGTIAQIIDYGKLDLTEKAYFHNQDGYTMTYAAKNLKENQGLWAIEVPLELQFEKKWGKHGIYAGIGVKGYFPFSTRIGFSRGEIIIDEVYDPLLNVTFIPDNVKKHLDPRKFNGQSVKPKMRCSVDILADFGGIFGIARNTDIYLGVYGSYGFLDILPKKGIELDKLDKSDLVIGMLADSYVNTSKKWNLWQVGAKIGFHFLPCKSCGNDEYLGDLKRKYMNDMMQKEKDPIVITNTVEYYYFVPTVSQELLDENKDNPDKKKAIMDLAEALSNIKILFDLDKDIPKLDESKRVYIVRAVELLKANPDLKVMITGYTSPEGTKDHNRDLGHRRAIAVQKLFLNQGTPADQISIKNYIAEDPQHKVDIPDTDWKEQRAVIFKIEKK
jgi:outer membrane protein OmpA-like peptidoglycan-associated protein